MHWQKCYGPKKGQQLAYCSHALCWKWGDLKGICIEWELQQLVMLYRLHISWPTAASMFLQAPKDIQIYQTEWMLLVQIGGWIWLNFPVKNNFWHHRFRFGNPFSVPVFHCWRGPFGRDECNVMVEASAPFELQLVWFFCFASHFSWVVFGNSHFYHTHRKKQQHYHIIFQTFLPGATE